LLRSVPTSLIEPKKDFPATGRVVGELDEKGGQQTTNVTFGVDLEIEVIKSDQGCGPFYLLDVFDNCRAYQTV
jgi:hypothetical protein